MRKTLIVDDDHLVRSYLKILPSWERAGFSIEADARDGEEALSILERADMDLLVTDISMPLMDGIELIRRVRQENQRVYIIVLSCHDEFAYVKDALKEGADDYVLKNTLNEDSLIQLLEATAQKMEERTRQHEERARVRRLAKAGDQTLKYAYFSKLAGDSADPRELEAERRRAGIRGAYRSCGAVCMRLESWEGEDGSASLPGRRRYCQDFLRRLPEALAEQPLPDGGAGPEIVYWGKGLFYGFLDLSDLREGSAMGQRLKDAALACARVCGGEPYPYAVGVSGPCVGGNAVRTAYRQTKELMRLRFYERRELLYYDAGRKIGTRVPEEARDLLGRLEELRRKGDRAGFLDACRAACGSFERDLVDKRLVRQWLWELEQKLGLVPEEGRLSSMEEVRRRLQEDARRIYRDQGARIPEGVSRAVSAAAEFAKEHFKEAVGLTEAAEAAGVNPTYLSYLFRREMGIGFSNFLLNQRIECAMALLRETNLKVREAAEQSGFHDYHYFAKVFKKINGLSPAEYRKKIVQD